MEATSRLIQAVGRVQSHAVAELRSPFPRWLLAGGCSPLLEASCLPWLLALPSRSHSGLSASRALLHLSDSSQRILSVFKDLCE